MLYLLLWAGVSVLLALTVAAAIAIAESRRPHD